MGKPFREDQWKLWRHYRNTLETSTRALPSPKTYLYIVSDKMLGDNMTKSEESADWFLAQLKPNCGQIAKRNMERQGFQTFLPQQEETTRHKGKFTTKLKPLFPGYIFVALDVLRGRWRAVNSTYGITHLVSFGNKPTTVPKDIILSLMQRCDADAILLPPPTLSAGDNVHLTSGPFTDFVATVEQIAPDKRVWVLLDLMGRQTRLAIGAESLRLT